jgi:hypothetical protein
MLSDIPTYARYEGMLVYQLSNETFYKFKQGVFSVFEGGSGGTTTSINNAIGNVWLVEGAGVTIEEITPGNFRFSVGGNMILTDGSVQMASGYVPTHPKDVVTVDYLEQELSTLITQPQATQIIDDLANKLDDTHANLVASETVLGHAKIDDESIKTDVDNKLYLALTDGGSF